MVYRHHKLCPAAFIAQPLNCKEGMELIVALQLPVTFMNEIMKVPEGMGDSGKTYLVGSDGLMRSDMPSDLQTHSVKASLKNPSSGEINTEPVKKALEGKTGAGISANYKGEPVISAYTPIKIEDFTWALVAEISMHEIISDSIAAKDLLRKISKIGIIAICIISVIILLILLFMIGFLRNLILKPLDILAKAAEKMAMYDLTINLNADNKKDEIGRLMSAAKNMILSLREIILISSNAAEELSMSAGKISGSMEEHAAAAVI